MDINKPVRLSYIDALRGLALVLMIIIHCFEWWTIQPQAANYMGIRILGSLAAPIFVTLVGMMITLNMHKHNLKHYLIRFISLFLIGFFLYLFVYDVVLELDILIFIAVVSPIIYLLFKIKYKYVPILCGIFSIVVFQVLYCYGYTIELEPEKMLYRIPGIFIGGAFPVLPWMIFPIIGGYMGRYFETLNLKKLVFASAFSLIMGIILIMFFGYKQWSLEETEGYLELFYPINIQYILMAIGAVLLVFCFFKFIYTYFSFNKLELLGRNSLKVYCSNLIFGHGFSFLDGQPILWRTLTPLQSFFGIIIFLIGIYIFIKNLKYLG